MKESFSSQSSNTSDAALTAEDLRGVFLPIPTPFDLAGDLDLVGLRSNINQWNTTGIRGYVMLGSTGERVHLDEREFLEVVDVAREAVATSKERLAFIVGAGQQSTRGTINEIKRVVGNGSVDAFLVITPSFYRPSISQAALITYYQTVADQSPAPIILYSMPALTGIRIEPETAARLSEHKNIIGIKDSSNDVTGLEQTVKLVQPNFAVLTGNGTVFSEALLSGARGGILAVGCVAPDTCLEIFAAVRKGDTTNAARLQAKLTPLATAVTVRFGIGGLKAALDMNGYAGGTVRAPLQPPGAETLAEIRSCLETTQPPTAKAPSTSGIRIGEPVTP
ncbi:MAG TPA: dihydrodipicolinate synthase family protein [Pyrinomonadaceae bacterium]|nr:dihydrodipicolinate synthase family protein [Pyrinomonadaceae bacterium]